MEAEDKLEPFNPWKVENIDQFLNYCCPECDTKQKTKSDFIVHAIDAHPDSREYLPLFDFEEDKEGNEQNHCYIDTFEPLKTRFSSSNSASVKLEPLSLNGLLKMECDEEDCGRFFVTQESMLDHKRQFHRKNPRRKIKKPKRFELDYVVEVIKPSKASNKYLETNIEYHTTVSDDFHQDGDSYFEPNKDSIVVIPEEEREKAPEKPKVSKKRKLTDSDDEYEKPICRKCDQKFPSQSAFNYHQKSVHSGEPKEAKRIGKPPKYIWDIDPTDGIQKYKCDECNMFFKHTNRVLSHKRRHHAIDQENKKCFLCAEVVPSKLLNIHMKRKHQNADGVFECNFCSELFKKSNSEQFMYHLTKEHQIGEFRHKCDQCDEVFCLKSQLENHKKIRHEKSCSVICDQCGKEMSYKVQS